MKKEEMLELFYQNVGKYENMSDEIFKYINCEIDKIPFEMQKSKNFYRFDSSFINEIKNELNGENDETAKRILYVFFKIQDRNIIIRHSAEEDVKLLISALYDFEEIIAEDYFKDTYNYTRGVMDKVIKILFDTFPDKVEAYASHLFNCNISKFKNRKELYSKTEDVLNFYLKLYCVLALLNADKIKYTKFIDLLVHFYKDAEMSTELIIILFKLQNYDKRLFEILKRNILSDGYVNSTIENYILEGTSFLEYLKKNNIKTYPYYAVVLCDYNTKKNKIINELFKKDKTTFYETYEFIAAKGRHSEYELYMCSIMFKNNERKDITDNIIKELKLYADNIMQRSDNNSLYEIAVDDYKSKRLIAENEFKNMLNEEMDVFTYGMFKYLIKAFSVIYDFVDNAEKFIDFIIINTKKYGTLEQLCLLINYFLKTRNQWLDMEDKKDLEIILNKGLIDIKDILKFLCVYKIKSTHEKVIFDDSFIYYFTKKYSKEALELFEDNNIKSDSTKILIWLKHVYNYAYIENTEIILNFINHSSKPVRDFCEEYMTSNEQLFREKLLCIIKNLKGESLKLAKRVIKLWDNEHKYSVDFKFKSIEEIMECVDENYDKSNEKYIQWIDESYFENVRFKDSSCIVPPKVIKFIINEYMALSEVYRIRLCDKIVESLNIDDFRKKIKELFDLWVEDNLNTKNKNIVIPYCVYSSDSVILEMKKYLEDFFKESKRSAVAAYIVNAIALNGGKTALMVVESIGNKFPNAKVRKTAKNAFKHASKVLQIPEDVLADKIVPDLGFDKYGKKIIDYGKRKFEVTLMDDFTISIFDIEKHKSIKNLPKPNDNDDKDKAESEKKEFSALKKQIKTIVKTQKERLEQAFANGRIWSVKSWKELFVENPLMQMFAQKLVWGIYDENGKIIDSFRYMEDGTFNNIDEEEYCIPENTVIAIAHPCEMDENHIEKWKKQINDYEIIQPFRQLDIEIKFLNENEIDENIIKRYYGLKTNTGKLLKLYNKYSLVRGEILDGGGFSCYHYIDKYLKIGVQINFEGMYVGIADFESGVDLENLIFYKIDDDFNDKPEDEIPANKILDPRKIPQRFVSSIISIFDTLIIK